MTCADFHLLLSGKSVVPKGRELGDIRLKAHVVLVRLEIYEYRGMADPWL
jgi:hypothetical protein